MVNRRGVIGVSVLAAAVVCSVTLLAQEKRKLDDQEKKEIQNVVKIVDGIASGQPAPNDLSLTWTREDFLKAQGNREYVPFVVSVDPSKLTSPSVFIYWRVVPTGAAATTDGQQSKDETKDKDKKDTKDTKNGYAYEDISTQPVTAGQTPLHIARSFTVNAGTYDVYVVVKEPQPKDKKAPAPKMSVMKQSVTVPDFWNGELNTSTVIVAQKIEPLPSPLTPQQQADRPYALGSMEITPAFDLKLSKKQELSTFMLIYNPKTDAANKPDVTVEYNFYTKQGGAEKFFNKTNPQNLNAQTLPPQFDLAAGHQLQSGQAVPLASFPEGEYRLEIKVTDKIANKTVTRDLNFSVAGA